MSRQKLNIIRSSAIPLPLENINTDDIIPARFLRLTQKKGFGKYLFNDWRYDEKGKIGRASCRERVCMFV